MLRLLNIVNFTHKLKSTTHPSGSSLSKPISNIYLAFHDLWQVALGTPHIVGIFPAAEFHRISGRGLPIDGAAPELSLVS